MPTWSHKTLRQQMLADGMYLVPECKDSFLLERDITLTKCNPDLYEDLCYSLGKSFDILLVRGGIILSSDTINLWKDLEHRLAAVWQLVALCDPDLGSWALLDNPSIEAIRFLRQYYKLNSKLITEFSNEVQVAAQEEWVERTVRIRQTRIQKDHPVLRIAQSILTRVLSNLSITDITPGHGPGAVAEGLKHEAKYEFKTWPKSAERFYPYLAYGVVSPYHAISKAHGVRLVSSTTRALFVPKDTGKPRLISAEPCAMQYLQQGQMRAIMKYLARHPVLRRCLPLQDRKVQQLRAWEASLTGDNATIDFSNASDTVSATLVWFLLSGVPDVRRRLWSTRSQSIRFDMRGGKFKISSFAPMGSANCFPIESLVFWALAVASVQLTRYASSRHPNRVTRETMLSVTVFGDDVIMPLDSVPTFEGTTTDLGMEFNTSKSCVLTPFRESCGAEWFDGNDVTVVRNRRLRDRKRLTVRQLPDISLLQRRFFVLGWRVTANFLGELCTSVHDLPTVSPLSYLPRKRLGNPGKRWTTIACQDYDIDRSTVLFGDVPLTGRAIRWNKNLQRLEVKVPLVHYSKRAWESSGFGRLLARLLGDASEEFILPSARAVKWKWTPVSFVFPSWDAYIGIPDFKKMLRNT
jgi:hypothetical protein